ncbi:hypothetical protein AUJ14_05630 [Candidatus Micrarchaeota archaeon CG1_02_55_22]|nr:MAG: hypothetical protein AUJ14_05630 [Candidatus Micrarchaeota archaeon CG1_02_55_22]
MGFIEDFVSEYFVKPLADPTNTAPYNAVNTLVFAALALAAAYLIFKGLKKFGIKIDEELVKSLVPFILLGSAVRAVVDAGILPRVVTVSGFTFYPFVTPVVYVLVFLAVVAVLAIAKSRPQNEFHRTLRAGGLVLFLTVFLPLVPLFHQWVELAQILVLAIIPLALYRFAAPRFKLDASFTLQLLVFSQAFDGGATLTGLGAGYFEQHVLGGALVAISPWLFYLIKVAFAFVVAYLLSREKDGEEKTFVALLITIFGLAPGVRDALRILAGV